MNFSLTEEFPSVIISQAIKFRRSKMSTREEKEKIEADIADAKTDKAKVEALIVEAGKKENDAYVLKLEDRLNEITKHIANLHANLENERQRMATSLQANLENERLRMVTSLQANLENERQRMATPLSKYNNLNKFVF